MATVTVFRQARVDGGIRTGFDIDGQTVVEQFEEGRGEHDPRLLWFVDLRFRGNRVPADSLAAKTWVKGHSDKATAGLNELADSLIVGVDTDYIPGEWPLTGFGRGVDAKVAYSSIRRIDAREMGKIVRSMAKLWPTILESLQPEHAA